MAAEFWNKYPPGRGSVIEPAQVDLTPLDGRTIAVIGYGTMGRAHALNLRRSGLKVLVGCRADSACGDRVAADGLPSRDVGAAAAEGDVVVLMLPDQAMGEVYAAQIAPQLRPTAALGFAHGFAVAFGQIETVPGQPCFLAAPKGQGDMLLALHEQGDGVPGLLAVTDDSPPATWDLAAAYAKAVGCLSGGGFVTTFAQECISDQFGEQAVLCGGVIELLKATFTIMVEAGYGEENAYFECVHELKLITDLLHQHGLVGMRERISDTAAYGGLSRGPRIIDDHVRGNLRAILAEIESGKFAGEFLADHADPRRGIAALRDAEAAGPLARTDANLRSRLPNGKRS
jgi:ketol-acid reductoisomerase